MFIVIVICEINNNLSACYFSASCTFFARGGTIVQHRSLKRTTCEKIPAPRGIDGVCIGELRSPERLPLEGKLSPIGDWWGVIAITALFFGDTSSVIFALIGQKCHLPLKGKACKAQPQNKPLNYYLFFSYHQQLYWWNFFLLKYISSIRKGEKEWMV